VGKTFNPKSRLKDHAKGTGSAWTKIYPPVKRIRLIPNCDVYDEDKYTLVYMEKYGISNVRGGSYCQVRLQKYQIQNLTNQIKGATDRCHKCGEKGHFMADCYKVKNSYKNNNQQWKDGYKCYKCGERGHLADSCTSHQGYKRRRRD
jgi:hypothetical protein